MTAEIISIGDELLIGQVINTNQAYIAEQLNSAGVTVQKMTTVGDSESAILACLHAAWKAHDIITVTGGLGPTHDDITRSVVAKFFDTDLVVDEETLEHVKNIFKKRGQPLLKINEDQALVPRNCAVIQNPNGTAPGYFFDREGKKMFVMPGVPFEMKPMMESYVLPLLRKSNFASIIRHRTLKTTGIAESLLANQLGDIDALLQHDPEIRLAFLPSPFGVRLRISVKTKSADAADRKIQTVENAIRSKVQKYIYGSDQEELEAVVGNLLAEKKLTLSVAESCTGGLIVDRLTDVPGSSRYLERGIITYSNESKVDELAVSPELIEKYGSVSKEVAEKMAEGIRRTSKTDIGISTTGIAGPTGGSEKKPIGTVWIGYSDTATTFALHFFFGNDRRRIKERASQAALELLRRKLLKIE